MPVPLSSIGRELGKERSSCRERRGLSGRSSRVAIVGKIMRKRERESREETKNGMARDFSSQRPCGETKVVKAV
jgi:hypothetical protein